LGNEISQHPLCDEKVSFRQRGTVNGAQGENGRNKPSLRGFSTPLTRTKKNNGG